MADFLQQSQKLAAAAAIRLINVGRPSTDNLAVTGLEADEPIAPVGRRISLRATLKQFAPSERAGAGKTPAALPSDTGRPVLRGAPKRSQAVELLVDGRPFDRKQVEIPAGGAATVDFTCHLETPGEHAIEVRARVMRWTSITTVFSSCRRGRRCGYCASTAARRARRSRERPTTWPPRSGRKATAARPTAGRFGPNWLPRARSSTAAWRISIAFSFAMSPNSPPATPARSTPICKAAGIWSFFSAIRSWPTATTGNWAWPKGLSRFFRQQKGASPSTPAGREGDRRRAAGGERTPAKYGLLPARLGAVVEQPEKRLDPLDYSHPILQAFRGRGKAGLLTAPVRKHFRLSLPRDLEPRSCWRSPAAIRWWSNRRFTGGR